MDVGDSLREHVEEKVTDITQKYFNHATDATVTFSREGHGHSQTKVHISIRVGKNLMINTDCVSNDPYGAFDTAAEKAGKRLRRYKRRLRDDHDRKLKTPEEELLKARDYVLAGTPDQEEAGEQDNDDSAGYGADPVVIAEMATHIEKLNVSDAVMRLELSELPALLFRNAQHGGLNMIYRRPDGNIGWVDPESES